MYYLIIFTLIGFSDSVSKLGLDGRIVGGNYADIKDFPYQLSLRLEDIHYCGATIISDYWAVTAAHCVADIINATNLEIYAGSSLRSSGGSEHIASLIIKHDLYNKDTLDYDIAVIKVHPPFKTNDKSLYEHEANLPDSNEEPSPGSLAITSGWGSNKENSSFLPNMLESVEVPIISRQVCSYDYPEENITDRMLCAGYFEGGKDTCQGDSGGPLVLSGTLIGLVSWGVGCGDPNTPGVYTNVVNLRDWIKDKTDI